MLRPPPTPRRGARARVGPLAVLLALLLAAPASAGASVKVYFLQGEQLVAVNRPGTTPADAISALVSGPTAAERRRKISTYLDRRTPIRSVSARGDMVTVDLGRRVAFGDDGPILTSRLAQVVYTATGLPGIARVRVLVEGGFPLGLFPGVDAADPLTRERLATPTTPAPPPPPEGGNVTAGTRALQRRLIGLGFLAAGNDTGVLGEQTRNAIVAFQKWSGLARDGVVGPATRRALDAARRPAPQASGPARRIEVLLDRQVTLLIAGGRVSRIVNVSTGAGANATPPGRFAIGRREARSWSVPFQVWLPWAAYFVGGIAFHEYPDVPPEPASHGCVRVPAGDAERLFRFARIGTPVIVLARS